jgi:hypothetical protein
MVFGRELRLSCDLLVGATRTRKCTLLTMQPTFLSVCTTYTSWPVNTWGGASVRMKASYDRLASSVGFQEGDQVWLYRPTWKRGKSSELPSCWERPYNVIACINVMVYHIQRFPRAKMLAVHLDRLAPNLRATRDEYPWGRSSITDIAARCRLSWPASLGRIVNRSWGCVISLPPNVFLPRQWAWPYRIFLNVGE